MFRAALSAVALIGACGGTTIEPQPVTRPDESVRLLSYEELFDREPGVYSWPVHVVHVHRGCGPCEGPEPCSPAGCGHVGVDVMDGPPPPNAPRGADGTVDGTLFVDSAGWLVDASYTGTACRLYVRLERIEGQDEPYVSLASNACDPQ